ncbi:hypothetical protein [Streptomyces sp. NPDC048710]|uniref:hypothetical protein n=1 Tax=Streptomyces sp. NPDC048710 TaxID=3365586 RepID=UPI00372157F1
MTRLPSNAGVASSGSRPLPLLPVMLTAPVTELPAAPTPPVSASGVSGPRMTLPAQAVVSSPIRT